MSMNKKVIVFLLFGLMLLLLTACGGDNNSGENNQTEPENVAGEDNQPDEKNATNEQSDPEPEPVELVFHMTGGADEERFMEKYGSYVAKEFPHITMKYIAENGDIKLPELVLENQAFDIIISSVGNLPSTFLASGMQYDITDLINKNDVSLDQFEKAPMDLMYQLADGSVYGLPDGLTNLALLYNRSLFNKFGVPYPEDGLTWDDTYELARTMTRTEGGVNYRGFVLTMNHFVLTNQLSPDLVDPETNKATFDTDERWSKFATNLNRFFQIPGNILDKDSIKTPYHVAAFEKDQTAAMFSTVRIPNADLELDWDVTKYPTFSELPGVGPQPYTGYILLSSTSEHKEQAFEVIEFLSTNEDYRMELSKEGISQPSLKDQSFKDAYGMNDPRFEGKNIPGFFPESNATSSPLTPYETIARVAFVNNINQYIMNEVDLNTALRNATEEANMKIAAENQ